MRELEKNQRFGMWEGRWERAVSAPFGKDGIGVRHNSTPWTTLHKIPKSFSHVGQQKVGSQLEPMSQKEDKNSHDITGQGIWASSPFLQQLSPLSVALFHFTNHHPHDMKRSPKAKPCLN